MTKRDGASEDSGFRGGSIVRHRRTGKQGLLIAVGGNGEWIVQIQDKKQSWVRHPKEEWEVLN